MGEVLESKTTRVRALVAAAPLVCAVSIALLAAPSAQTLSATGTVVQLQPASAGPGDRSGGVSEAMELVVAPLPMDESVEPVTHSEYGGRVAVSGVVMVVNDDGSATLSATFEGGGRPVALESVHIESDSGDLDVASTRMWLPILPGQVSRAGDASDAGGFVVPRGVAPGQTVHVQLEFDDNTCMAIDARAVRRNSTHDEVFPNNGQQLGPGKRTAAHPECPSA